VRLSDWRARAPHRESRSPRVLAVIEPALLGLGAERDPHGWVAWGDDPGLRFLALAATTRSRSSTAAGKAPAGKAAALRRLPAKGG
jgi:hypothetical protein